MATNLLSLFNHIQQQGDIGRAQGQQSKLAQLASQAYAAPTPERSQYVQQAIGVDPDAGFALGKQLQGDEDTRMKRVGQMAGMLLSAPEQARAALYSGQIVPEMHKLGFGDGLPDQWTDDLMPTVQQIAQQLGASGGDELKSLRIGANGNYWAIRGGQFVDTGTPAAPNTYVRDHPGTPFDILDKRSGRSIYDQQPQGAPQLAPNSAYQTPNGIVRIGDVAPDDMAAVEADMRSGGAQDNYALPSRDVSPQDRPPARPDPSASITPYQQAQLAMQQQRLAAAQSARDQAEAARRTADEVRAAQKQQVAAARQAEAATAANTLVNAIDGLLQAPGYADLGTPFGDVKINTPMIRNDAKDADAQLKNIAGQVALSTMARLKALSSQGATGFGALSAPELKLLQNAIATLQSEDISNAQLTKSLKTIRDTVSKVSEWQPNDARGQPAQSGAPLRYNPATGDFE